MELPTRAPEAVDIDLTNGQAFVRRILSSSISGLYLYDLTRRSIVYISPQYTALTGYTLEQVCARSGEELLELFHPDDRARVVAHIEAAADVPDDEVREIDYRFRRADGCWIWCLSRETAFERAADGSVSSYIGTFIDITKRKQAEEELRRAHWLLEGITTGTGDMIAAYDCELRYLFVNEALRQETKRVWGIAFETGTSLHEALAAWPEEREKAVALLRRALSGESFRTTIDFGAAEHDRQVYDLRFNPLFDGQGRQIGAASIQRNVTEQVRAQQSLRASEERLGLALDAAGAAAWEVDLATGRRTWDTRLPGLLRLPPEACAEAEQRWGRFLLPEDRAATSAAFAAACQPGGPPYDCEFRARRIDGGVRWFHSRGIVLSEPGGGRRMVGVVQDITESKMAEQRLLTSRDELEQLARTLEERVHGRAAEAERRAAQVRQLHAELSRAEQRQRRQLAGLLHDGLQQLLVAATIRLTLARREAGEHARPMLEEVRHILEQCIDAARSLTMQLSPPVLHDRGLIPALHWLARQMSEKHALAVEVRAAENAEPAAEDVRLLLFQAARELLFNVAKHASTADAVVTLERDDSRLRLEVADQGAGFAPAAVEAASNGGGSYGLTSVQQRIEWLGGTMEIDSAPGQGTRVRLHVPVGPMPTAGVAERPAVAGAAGGEAALDLTAACGVDASQQSRVRVLLADDHKVVREGLVSLLAGYPDLQVVAQAADGEEAVRLAHEHRPDIVVMDLSMPKLDGIEATRRIAAELPDVRVVGLSMHESRDVADAMRAAGAVGYARKGGPVGDLIALIRTSARA